jgi:hypothetical protein
MNRELTADAIKIMQAYVDGKTIETRVRRDKWFENSSPGWNWEEAQYRIKPEPMEIEVWVNPDGSVVPHGFHELSKRSVLKKFREVL